MKEKRSVDDVIDHYRGVIHRSPRLKRNPTAQIDFLLQLVGTRTAMVRTYVALLQATKEI